jgi:hypothetical protein
VPLIVNVYVPPGVAVVVFTVSVDVPDPLTEVGLKLAVVLPPGNPLTPNPTVPLNPPSDPTVTV